MPYAATFRTRFLEEQHFTIQKKSTHIKHKRVSTPVLQKYASLWLTSALGWCKGIWISCLCGCVRPGIVLYLSSFDRISFSTISCRANVVTSHVAPDRIPSSWIYWWYVIRLCNFAKTEIRGKRWSVNRLERCRKWLPFTPPLLSAAAAWQNRDWQSMQSYVYCDTHFQDK